MKKISQVIWSATTLLLQGGMILFILVPKAEAWMVRSDPSTDRDIARAITHDGTYIYVAGMDAVPGDYEWRIEKRRKSDGSLVWAQTSNPSTGSDWAYAITNDGTYLYVAGYDSVPGNIQWRIEKRRKSDGGLEWTQTSNPSTSSDFAFAITNDGTYLYVAGYDASNSQWRIEKRWLSSGDTVWTKTSNPSTGGDWARAITHDGTYLYVAGDDYVPGNWEWRIEKRWMSDGSLVWAQRSNPSTSLDRAYAITHDGTYLYVAGQDRVPGNYEWRIEKRSMSSGGLVWAQTIDPTGATDEAYAITHNGTYLYVAGHQGTGDNEWRLEKRWISTGTLRGTYEPSGSSGTVFAITYDGTYLYVAGSDWAPGCQWRIEQIDTETIGIELSDSTGDNRTYLGQAIPNPFTQKTAIEVRISRKELDKGISPTIQIYDLGGRIIKSLPIPNPRSPITKVVWDGRDNKGKLVPKGIYFCLLKTADSTLTRKLIRIK